MDQTSSKLAGTMMSPAIFRELADVRSIRTATSSQESSLSLTSFCSVPPNHHTFKDVVVVVDDDDDARGTFERPPVAIVGTLA